MNYPLYHANPPHTCVRKNCHAVAAAGTDCKLLELWPGYGYCRHHKGKREISRKRGAGSTATTTTDSTTGTTTATTTTANVSVANVSASLAINPNNSYQQRFNTSNNSYLQEYFTLTPLPRTIPKKSRPQPPALPTKSEWKSFWSRLESQGWTKVFTRLGDQNEMEYYIRKGSDLTTGVRGVDIFTDKGDLMKVEHLLSASAGSASAGSNFPILMPILIKRGWTIQYQQDTPIAYYQMGFSFYNIGRFGEDWFDSEEGVLEWVEGKRRGEMVMVTEKPPSARKPPSTQCEGEKTAQWPPADPLQRMLRNRDKVCNFMFPPDWKLTTNGTLYSVTSPPPSSKTFSSKEEARQWMKRNQVEVYKKHKVGTNLTKSKPSGASSTSSPAGTVMTEKDANKYIARLASATSTKHVGDVVKILSEISTRVVTREALTRYKLISAANGMSFAKFIKSLRRLFRMSPVIVRKIDELMTQINYDVRQMEGDDTDVVDNTAPLPPPIPSSSLVISEENKQLKDQMKDMNKLKADVVELEKALKREEDKKVELEDTLNCIICCMFQRNVLFSPCNHLLLCSDCSEKEGLEVCPNCSGDVDKKVKVFM